MYQKVCSVIATVVFLCSMSVSYIGYAADNRDPFDIEPASAQQMWVDSIFHTMSFEDRLGQLFMVAAYSNKGQKHNEEISKLIREQKLGGLIFFQGGPVRQAHLTNHYQALSEVPLFIAMDAEWGPGMRLDSVIQFPKQMTLGAGAEEDLIYAMGSEIARQFKELGMHINFAPVVDVNSNPDNPVIGYRAFGEGRELVSRKSIAYMKGLQDNGIMANAKHFPGHGDTDVDSHVATPVISNSKQRIQDIDLYPYRQMIQEGLMSVMVAHLHVPSLGSQPNMPTTLSPQVVTGLLKDEMNFKGLVFTDAMNMRGVSKLHPPGEADLLALKAGNDVLLYSENVPMSKALIMQAIENGEISREEIDAKVSKILQAKYWAGLYERPHVDPYRLGERISTSGTRTLIEQLYASSITVAKNETSILPLRIVDVRKMASLTLGDNGREFKEQLDKYGKFSHFTLSGSKGADHYQALEDSLKAHDTIIIGVMGVTNSPKRNYGISLADLEFINRLKKNHEIITVVFGNAYAAKNFEHLPTLMLAYEKNEFTERLVPQVIFGARPASGTLPVSLSTSLVQGVGCETVQIDRLAFSTPESQGMDSRVLQEIDDVMEEAISKKAFPGGVVLVAKNGKVVFESGFGHLDYSKTRQVDRQTVYDLASLTKVMATTQVIMFMHSRGLIDMNMPIENYLPELKATNKGQLLIKDIMAHESGLLGWIPHFGKTMDGNLWGEAFYSRVKDGEFSIPVADGMYAHRSLPDSVWHWTVQSNLLTSRNKRNGRFLYKYSDIGMYLLHRLIEKQTNQPMDEFLEQNFYAPLGIYRLGYRPLDRFDRGNIAPTEEDVIFRKTLVHGYVHDPGAAMYGGVAGHAGLFGTAYDVAVLMQMMLQGGKYGGVELLDNETVSIFTQNQSGQSRRGWGWDKPERDPTKRSAVGQLAPLSTFGHTGFTGTAVWADPDNQLLYIFLSNRVHPSAGNNLITKEKIRGQIHDIIYKSFRKEFLLADN